MENIEKELKKIKNEILNCKKCSLYKERFESKSLFQSIPIAKDISKFRFAIIPFCHPAVATYNPNMKGILIKDFKILERFK